MARIVGTNGNDTLNGTPGDDIINGRGGADIMVGSTGNDLYYVNNSGDQTIEAAGAGTDTVFSTIDFALAAAQEIESLRVYGTAGLTLTGNGLGNILVGGSGSDTLNGGIGNDLLNGLGGADIMAGGGGNDRYYVDSSDDQVTEAPGQGTDTVSSSVNYTLATDQEIEILRVSGTAGLNLAGNNVDNYLIGGAGNDTLDGGSAGNDRFFGGGGDDSITTNGQSAFIGAGDGDDSIQLNSGSSTSMGRVNGGTGNDTIHSAELGQFVIINVETLDTYYGFLNGTAAQIASFDHYTAVLADDPNDVQISFSLRGAGGTLDFTTGISGQNSVEIRDAGLTAGIRVTGSTNGDLMFGSAFNDVLKGGEGNDTLFGNEGLDTLVGGAGNDVLNGGPGNDKLNGGIGNDTFAFNSPFGPGQSIDVIADFVSGTDTIQLDRTYFSGFALGQLAAGGFSNSGATGAGPQIVYNQVNGALYYDSNGAGLGGATHFATLTGVPTLTATDFMIV